VTRPAAEQGASHAEADLVSVLTEPHWVAAFMALAVVLSFVPFAVGFVMGLSVTNTSVFGAYALISGVLADLLFRRILRKVLVVVRSPNIPFVALWVGLCAYVIVFTPF